MSEETKICLGCGIHVFPGLGHFCKKDGDEEWLKSLDDRLKSDPSYFQSQYQQEPVSLKSEEKINKSLLIGKYLGNYFCPWLDCFGKNFPRMELWEYPEKRDPRLFAFRIVCSHCGIVSGAGNTKESAIGDWKEQVKLIADRRRRGPICTEIDFRGDYSYNHP